MFASFYSKKSKKIKKKPRSIFNSLFVKRTPDVEPHEIFLDSLAKNKEKEFGISEKKFEIPLSFNTLKLLFVFCIILILILFGKIFQIQIINGKEYSLLAEKNRFKFSQIKSERGIIYDKNLKQLVENKASFDLICQKNNLPIDVFERKKILKTISFILNKNYETLEKEILESDQSTIVISENLNHQTLVYLEARIEDLSGFQIRKNTIREYKDGKVFSHIIGHMGKITAEELKTSDEYSIFDWVGKDGLERYYENILKEKPGKIKIEKDVLGNIISQEIIQSPESGKNLVLWIDSDLQKKIEEELRLALEKVGAKSGAAVAIDPKTGGVLSLVSLPSYDNNLFRKGTNQEEINQLLNDSQKPLFNRAISGGYVVGSVIKPLIAVGALEEKIISSQKEIYCQGGISITNKYNPEIIYKYEDWKIHGNTNLRKALAESCNVYFYTVGGGYEKQEGLGPTRIKKYLGLFGWGEKTGIDLPGEFTGFLPDPDWKKETKKENWWDGDTYHYSIGQGDLLITPLQVANAFSAIANGGILYQPQIVKEIVDKEKNVIEEFKPKIIREININQENLKIVKEGMREAVIYGTAKLLNNLQIETAAKTGTAETYKSGYYHNWISVFAPYENPQIVLTVVLFDVKGALGAAVPVAKNVLEWYFTQKNSN